MPITTNNNPIDGKKFNKLLKDIREGRSEYVEHEINEAFKKSQLRKYNPPTWIWFFYPIMSVFTFSVGTKKQFDVVEHCSNDISICCENDFGNWIQ